MNQVEMDNHIDRPTQRAICIHSTLIKAITFSPLIIIALIRTPLSQTDDIDYSDDFITPTLSSPPPLSRDIGISSGTGKEKISDFVNPFNGSVNFAKTLYTMSNRNGIQYPVTLTYSGAGVENTDKTFKKFASTSWVGLGFDITIPKIYAEKHNISSLENDEYIIQLPNLGTRALVQIEENKFVLKTKRQVVLERHLIGEDIDYWTLTNIDGTVYEFGQSNNFNNQWERRREIHNGYLSLMPNDYYTSDTPPRTLEYISDEWYLRKISDRQSEFALYFEYEDHYLKKIYKLNSNNIDLSASNVISELTFNSTTKNSNEYYDQGRVFEFFRPESKQLNSLQLKENNIVKDEIHFTYDATTNNSTRLQRVEQQTPYKNGLSEMIIRPFYVFDYYSTTELHDAYIKSITDVDGAIFSFEYSSSILIPESAGKQEFDLHHLHINPSQNDFDALNIPGLEIGTEEVFYTGEFGDRYYLGIQLQDVPNPLTSPGDLDRRPQKILIEFIYDGNKHKLSRIFKPLPASTVQFHMAPDGSYFIWSSDQQVQVWDLKKRNISDDLIIIENNDPIYSPEATLDISEFTNRYYSIITFHDWFVVTDHTVDGLSPPFSLPGNHLAFFGRDQDTWTRLTCHNSVRQNLLATLWSPNGNPENRTGCLEFQNNGVTESWTHMSVQGGSNFLVVAHHSKPNFQTMPRVYSFLHVYVREGNQIIEKSFPARLEESYDKYNTNNDDVFTYFFSGPIETRYPTCNNGFNDCSSAFIGLHNLSIYENLIGLSVFSKTFAYSRPLRVFLAFDGDRYQYIHDYYHGSLDTLRVIAGPGYFLHKREGLNDNLVSDMSISLIDMKSSQNHTSVPWPQTTHVSKWNKWGALPGKEFIVEEKFTDKFYIGNIGKFRESAHYHNDGFASLMYLKNTSPISFQKIAPVDNNQLPISLNNIQFANDKLIGRGEDGSYKYATMPMSGFTQTSELVFENIPNTENKTCKVNSIGVMCYDYSGGVSFIYDIDKKIYGGQNVVRVIDKVVLATSGVAGDSKTQDGTMYITNYSYGNSTVRFNSQKNIPIFDVVDISNPTGNFRNEYFVSSSLTYQESDTYLHGQLIRSMFTKDEHGTGSQRSEKVISVRSLESLSIGNQPDLKEKVWTTQTLESQAINKFWNYEKRTGVRFTFFDEYNNLPKISISRAGNEYLVRLIRFKHEFENPISSPLDQLVQTVNYVFTFDPCAGTPDPDVSDICSNLFDNSLAFFMDINNSKRAVNSSVTTYDANTKLAKEFFEWRPTQLGVSGLTSVDGSMSSGVWRKTDEILKRSKDNIWAKSKSWSITEIVNEDIFTTSFYGGNREDLLGRVSNSNLNSVAILTGEEENVNPNPGVELDMLGAFGRWSIPTGTVVETGFSHTGNNSIKVENQSGPTIDLALGANNEFLSRNKGMVVSFWIMATPNSNPMARVEILTTPTSTPVPFVDVIQQYANQTGSTFPENIWVKVEYLISRESLEQLGFYLTNTMIFRFWAGKANNVNTNPIYVDDVRVYPSDAVVNTFNYDDLNRVTSVLDENNNPEFPKYNIWGDVISSKGKNGLVYFSNANRRYGED